MTDNVIIKERPSFSYGLGVKPRRVHVKVRAKVTGRVRVRVRVRVRPRVRNTTNHRKQSRLHIRHPKT